MSVQFYSSSAQSKTQKPSRRVDAPDAAIRAGFDLYLEGRSVMLRRNEPDGEYVLLGHIRDGAGGNPCDPSWNVGRYSDLHDGFVEISGYEGQAMTLAEAIDAAAILPDLDGEQRTYDNLNDAISDTNRFVM